MKPWTRETGLAALKALAVTLGRTPTSRDMGAGRCPSTQFFLDTFGSIGAAQRAAGLPRTRRGRKLGSSAAPRRVELPPIDAAKAAAITAQKKTFWQRRSQGLHGLDGWQHPYARKTA